MASTTLSIGIPNWGGWAGGDWQALLDVGRACDEIGIDRLIVNDHVVMGADTSAYVWGRFPTASDAPWLEPLTVLTAIAAVTSKVRLSTGVLIAPVRPAAVLAKTIATLDALSAGRVDLGVGTGWQAAEYDAVGLSFEERGSRLDDTIGACRALWTQSPAAYQSATVSFTDTYCSPRPTQDRIPVWFAGPLTARNLRRIVEHGDGWIPIMGATLDDIRAGAQRLRQETDRSLVVQAPAPIVTNAAGERDPGATMAGIPQLLDAGATDIYANLAAFAGSPEDARGALEALYAGFEKATS